MTGSTLFAHLALRFRTQPETLAAEALAYIVAGSPDARAALAEVCSIAAPGIPTALQVRTERRDPSDGPPALIGFDGDGAVRIVVEPRFWTGLPAEQPVRALRQLAADRASALLVLAPAQRFTTIWAELRRRCRLAQLPVHGDHAAGAPVRWTRVGPGKTIVLASWSVLLAGIRAQLAGAGDRRALTELDQLAELCEQMDSDAFLPLAPAELAAISPRRLLQLHRLLDDLAAACEARGLGTGASRDAAAGTGYAGRFLHLGSSVLFLCLSLERWATLRETPFWLLVYDASRRPARGAEPRLDPLASEIPPRLLRDPETGCPLVPLFPPVGAERATVLAELSRQVEEVVRLLGETPTAGFGSPADAARPAPDDLGAPPTR